MKYKKIFYLIILNTFLCIGITGFSYGEEKSIYVNVGKTKIAINVPPDFAEVKPHISPELWDVAKSWTPDTKELLAMMVEKGVIGSSILPKTYLLVQAPKQNQASILSDDDFDRLKKELKTTEKSSEENNGKEDEAVKDPEKTQPGFISSKRLQPGSFSLGFFHETLNSIGTADIIRQIVKVEGEKRPHFTVVATTILFLKGQLFYMYVFKEYNSEPDSDWVEIMSEHWVNTTITINHYNKTAMPKPIMIPKKTTKSYKTDPSPKQAGDVTLYFKNGRSLVCEKVWREGNQVFVIGKGKKYAVSYSESEIDLKKTFGDLSHLKNAK